MAQSFNAISTSLGEAERTKDGKPWTKSEYKQHKTHYNIDQEKAHLNEVLISVNGRNEKTVVNDFMMETMRKLNQQKVEQVKKWNDEHVGKINEKTGKPYKKRSISKNAVFPIDEFAKTGKRQMPYDTFVSAIKKGNDRGKVNENARTRNNVLQQYVVGLGSTDEWTKDFTRSQLKHSALNGGAGRDTLINDYFKKYLKQFQEENPHMHVVQAVVHFDETNPHMQFTVLPHVDGKEYGGLGSVSYANIIKLDHPEISKIKTVDEFYQDQHNKIRNIIENTPTKYGKMKLGERPGSHVRKRVDKVSEIASKEQILKAKERNLDEKERNLTKNVEKQVENKLSRRLSEVNTQETMLKNAIFDVKTRENEVEKREKALKTRTNELNRREMELTTRTNNFMAEMERKNAEIEAQKAENQRKSDEVKQKSSNLAVVLSKNQSLVDTANKILNNLELFSADVADKAGLHKIADVMRNHERNKVFKSTQEPINFSSVINHSIERISKTSNKSSEEVTKEVLKEKPDFGMTDEEIRQFVSNANDEQNKNIINKNHAKIRNKNDELER